MTPKASAIVAGLLILGLPLVLLCPGCRVVQSAVNAPGQTVRAITPGKKDGRAVDPVEVQQFLLRFADEYSMRMVMGVEQLRRGTNALDPAEALQWRIALGSATCSIVSGANAVANLLDMAVFVTATRMALEEHWEPKVFGESARPMLEGCRNAETQLWRFAGNVLSPEQQEELRAAIEGWQRQEARPENVLSARAVGFASQVAQASKADTSKSGSVFNLLMLDPLAGLDPATREIAQTRLFAERALYVAQRMPVLLRLQTELLTVNAVKMPAVEQLVTNSTQIAASVERFAAVVEKLPGQLSTEREEILNVLQAQEKQLTPLVNEVRQTLVSGTQLSTSLNTTLTTFDALMKRFDVGEPRSGPPDTNSPPFNILDYAKTAEQIAAMAQQLNALIKDANGMLDSPTLDKRIAELNKVSSQARTDAKSVLNHAFLLGAGLILLAFACAVVYRRLGCVASRPS